MREGDRSEYYAQVLLSALGLCSPIPRQEDIGFDFLCSLADQDSKILTFGWPHMVSVKSASYPTIPLFPSKTDIEGNSQSHILWLYRQHLPVFLAVVDKSTYSLNLHSLLPVWFLCYEGGIRCGSLELKPRDPSEQGGGIDRPKDCGERDDWKGMHHFEIDLGHPIVRLDPECIADKERMTIIRHKIRLACNLWNINDRHNQMGIPFFTWLCDVAQDGSAMKAGWFHQQVGPCPEFQSRVLDELTPSLVSLALNGKSSGDDSLLGAIGILMRRANRNAVPREIMDALPEIFSPDPDASIDLVS